MEEEKKENVNEEIKTLVDNKIKEFISSDINANNLDAFYKLIDIKKDLENIDYWNKKKEEIKNEIQR